MPDRSPVVDQKTEAEGRPGSGAGAGAVPWRTEGLPGGESGAGSPKGSRGWGAWQKWALWATLLYVAVFAALSIQDQSARPQPVPYTEFKAQVASNNVSEIFARETRLREP